MYYISKIPGQTRDQPVHIHVKNNKRIVVKNTGTECSIRINNGWLREVKLSLRQTEQLFNAKFRMVTNDDKTKTRVFL